MRYATGTTKELRDIWKAARSFEIDCYSLSEKILLQMLFSGAFVGERMDIFRYYVSQGARQEIEEAVLVQSSYDYFCREKMYSGRSVTAICGEKRPSGSASWLI